MRSLRCRGRCDGFPFLRDADRFRNRDDLDAPRFQMGNRLPQGSDGGRIGVPDDQARLPVIPGILLFGNVVQRVEDVCVILIVVDEDVPGLNLWEGDRFFLPWLDKPGFFSGKFTYVDNRLVDHYIVGYP